MAAGKMRTFVVSGLLILGAMGWSAGDSLSTNKNSNASEALRSRFIFLSTTTIKAGVFTPVIFNHAFDKMGSVKVTGTSLLATGGSFFAAMYLTRDIVLHSPQAVLMGYGGTLGLLYPQQIRLLLHYATGIDTEYAYRKSDGSKGYRGILPSRRIQAWSTLLTYPYGMYVGWRTSLFDKCTLGAATVMTYLSQTIGSLGYLLPLAKYAPEDSEDKKRYFTLASLSTMFLIPTGYLWGARMAEEETFSSGAGIQLYITGTLATLTAAGVARVYNNHEEPEDYRQRHIYTAATFSGYVIGTYMGFRRQMKMKPTLWQSAFIGAVTTGSSLITGSIPFMAGKRIEKDEDYFIGAGLAGAWLGYFIGEKVSERLPGILMKDADYTTFSLHTPGLWQIPVLAAGGDSGENRRAVPVVGCSWRF
ncbi:MAG: hypothetical protein GF401_09445 [Chitinivibrionales bacterium]|nr:hypothetical protein [Chitinivibrionales bacterium]